jgi:hypothetical protein
MKTSEKSIIKGFRAVEFMRQERDRIGKETQGMNFTELKKYFDARRNRVMPPLVAYKDAAS